jgi:ADP-ribose pyrophosphatase YjhB (NUDIX family)
LEFGETPEEACLRELKEEVGVSGELVKLIGVRRIVDEEIYGDLVAIGYSVRITDEQMHCNGEVEDAKFFTMDGLPDDYIDLFRDEIEGILYESNSPADRQPSSIEP